METPPNTPGAGDDTAPPVRSVPWRGWEAALVYVIQFVVAQTLLGLAAVFGSKNFAVVFGVVVGELILLAAVLIWVRARHGASWETLGWSRANVRGDIGAGIAAGIAGMGAAFFCLLIINLVGRAFDKEFITPDQVPLKSPGLATVVLLGLAVSIIAPIAEETFFRGFLFQAVRKWMPFAAAGAWSAALFGLAHFYPVLYLPIGALGFVLASVFESRKSIIPCVVAHALFNGVNFAILAQGFE